MRDRLIFRYGLPPPPPIIRSTTPDIPSRRRTIEDVINQIYYSFNEYVDSLASNSTSSSSFELPSVSSFVPIDRPVEHNIDDIVKNINRIHSTVIKIEYKKYSTLKELIEEVRKQLMKEIKAYNEEIVERLENIDELVKTTREIFRKSFSNENVRYPRILALHGIIDVLNKLLL